MKPKTYVHLTADEQNQICALRAAGYSQRQIAQALGRHHTTISRELRRNAPPVHTGYYLSHKAHELEPREFFIGRGALLLRSRFSITAP